VEAFAARLKRPRLRLDAASLDLLQAYRWPGNVRELENAIERAIVTSRGRVLTEENFSFLARRLEPGAWSIPPNTTLHELEKRAIVATLERTQGNVKEAAVILGIDRSTLYEKIKRYEIPR
jgi:two-component system response regulator HydG